MSTPPHTNILLRLIPWIALVVVASASFYYIQQLHESNEQEIAQRQQLETRHQDAIAELHHTLEKLADSRREGARLYQQHRDMQDALHKGRTLLLAAEDRITEQENIIEQLRDERNVYKSSLKQLQKQQDPNAQKSTIDYEAQSDELYDPSIFGLPDSPESGTP